MYQERTWVMSRQNVEYNKSRVAYYAYYSNAPEIPFDALGQAWQVKWLNVVRALDAYERSVERIPGKLRKVRKDAGVPRKPYKNRKAPD
jgi:hypothetical protein